MSGGAIVIDQSGLPLVIVRVHGDPTAAEVDAYLVEMTALLGRKQPYAVVLDARKMGSASAYARARAQEWLRAHRADLEAYSVGTAYLVSSAVMRFVVATILLFSGQPGPYVVRDSFDEAVAWAKERLANQRGTS